MQRRPIILWPRSIYYLRREKTWYLADLNKSLQPPKQETLYVSRDHALGPRLDHHVISVEFFKTPRATSCISPTYLDLNPHSRLPEALNLVSLIKHH
jgi:hypothetical protein